MDFQMLSWSTFPAGQATTTTTELLASVHARDGGGSPKVPSTSSLLFGFLISFLALFVILTGFGLKSRYMVDRRRRERLTPGLNPSSTALREKNIPVFWDVWTAPGCEKWQDMMPLATEIRSQSTARPPERPDRSGRASSEQVTHLYHGFGRVGGLGFAPPHRAASISLASPSRARSRITRETVDLQICVLVAMPSSHSHVGDRASILEGGDMSLDERVDGKDSVDLTNVIMGVATIPWDNERLDFG